MMRNDRSKHRQQIGDNYGLEAMSNLTPQDMKVTDIRDFIKLATDLERQNRLIIDNEENDDGLKENMTVRIYLPEKDEDCED